MKFHGENNVHELGDDVDLERAQRTRKLELHVSFEVKFGGFLDPVMTCGGDVDDPTPCLNETRWNEREQRSVCWPMTLSSKMEWYFFTA